MQSLVLCVGYAVYLVFGAVIFMYVEYDITTEVIINKNWHRLKEIVHSTSSPENEDELTILISILHNECDHLPNDTSLILTSRGNQSEITAKIEELCTSIQDVVVEDIQYLLTFIDALYFSMTVTTTIGYGHISPATSTGKIACILYACIGIPFTGILLAWTSDFFSERLFQLFKAKISTESQNSKKFIALTTTIYILIGLVVFIFIPAIVFCELEDWSYLTSVYYAFITLTTIGFGDFVTGGGISGPWHYAYQILVIIWILVGLGYWIMIANFITKALQSEKLHNSLLKRAEDVKKMMGMNTDPRFLTQHSKATVNFMLQLSNLLVTPDGVGGGFPPGVGNNLSNGNGKQHGSSNSTSPTSPVAIPGIAALFANQRGAGAPSLGLFSPGMFGINKNQPEAVPKSPESTRTVEEIVVDVESINESEPNSRSTSFKNKSNIESVSIHPEPSASTGVVNKGFTSDP